MNDGGALELTSRYSIEEKTIIFWKDFSWHIEERWYCLHIERSETTKREEYGNGSMG